MATLARGLAPLIAGAGAASLYSPQDAEALTIGPTGLRRMQELGLGKVPTWVGPDGFKRGYLPDTNTKFNLAPLEPTLQYTDLPEVMDNPLLYKIYPELKDIKMYRNPEEIDVGAVMYPSTGIMGIEYSKKHIKNNPVEIAQTILHEVQHGVQDMEGLTRGTSPFAFRTTPAMQAAAQRIKSSDMPNKKEMLEKLRRADSFVKEAKYWQAPGEKEARLTEALYTQSPELAPLSWQDYKKITARGPLPMADTSRTALGRAMLRNEEERALARQARAAEEFAKREKLQALESPMFDPVDILSGGTIGRSLAGRAGNMLADTLANVGLSQLFDTSTASAQVPTEPNTWDYYR